jgi:uncharacterized protein YjgD (DUF1641 family)
MFNFFGTCSRYQWEAFKAFSIIQKTELQLRNKWLSKELYRVGVFITTYDLDNLPESFSVTPVNSYGAKLLSAYKILGGNPEKEMLLRTRDLPVFLNRGDQLNTRSDGLSAGGYADTYTNGRRWRGGQRYDRDLGLCVEKLKNWQLESIKAKREKLEYKIKKALDYSDQLQQEQVLIKKLLTESGSVDALISKIEVQMLTPYTSNTTEDRQDMFGLNIGNVSDRTLAAAEELAMAEGQRGGPGGQKAE